MKIKDIANELQKIELPYISVKESHGLTDCVHIHASLQGKNLWVNGYIENSPRLLAFVFCNGQRENENSTYSFHITVNGTGRKLRQRSGMTGDEALIYVKTQLEKLKGGEI